MEKKNIIKASNILYENRINKKMINSFPKECIPINFDEAYKIQDELMKLYLSIKNNKLLGKKVGCTNNKAQAQLNINTPFYGNLFSNYSNKNGCKLYSKNFTNPYIEPEFSFKINQDIDISKAPFDYNDVIKFIKSIIPSIEIVDFRFNGNIKNIGVYNIVASNAASEYWIQGEKEFEWNSIDLYNHSVEVFINNKFIEKGNSSNVLQNPINSLLWIINNLAKKNEPILKNYIISTGTCTSAIQLNENSKIKVDFNDLGNVEFDYN